MKTVVVVEDDPDVQFLVRTLFGLDPRFYVAGIADSAEDAIELARDSNPEVIVLDHGLAGELTGIEAVPSLKQLAPGSRIILFTAHADLWVQAEAELGIDAFLLKTSASSLLAVTQQLTCVGPIYG